MYLESLQLSNFRNYKEGFFHFRPKVNLIVGANTKGKTNLLEAIYLGVFFRSFRTNESASLVQEGAKNAFVKLNFVNEGNKEKQLMELFFKLENHTLRRSLKLNGVKKKGFNFTDGNFRAVLFTPQDLNLVTDLPLARRGFLDRLLSQLNSSYYHNLVNYKKVIQSRNRLLFLIQEGKAKLQELDFWNKQFLKLAEAITQERLKLIEKIKPLLKSYYQKIANTTELDFGYKFSFPFQENLTDSLKNELESVKIKELELAQTLLGPHHDDWELQLNKRNLAHFGSRGEQRSAIIALKLTELALTKEKIGESPVLLLDDVLSELDQKRQQSLLNLLNHTQVLITTTKLDLFEAWRKSQKINLIEL